MTITDQHLAAYIEKIFVNYDRDGSGTLEASELTVFFNDVYRAMGNNQGVSPHQAQQALGILDKDFNGRITKAELFNAFKEVLMKEGFLINNQQMYQNTGHNYNQALDQWRISEQMGYVLPNFGQAINQNMNQGSYPQGQNYGYSQNPYQFSQVGSNEFQQLGVNFTNQQNFNQQTPQTQGYSIDPAMAQSIQQQQLNQMIAMQNQMIAQHNGNIASQLAAQYETQRQTVLEAQKAQI